MASIGRKGEMTRSVATGVQVLGRISWLVAIVLLMLVIGGCGGKQDREAAHFDRGKELFAQRDLVAASAEFENTIRVNPTNVEARYFLALVQESRGRWLKARSIYNEVLSLAPAHVGAIVHKGLL